MASNISPWSYIFAAGISESMLLDIAGEKPVDLPNLPDFPSYGILVEMLNFAVTVSSSTHFSTSQLLIVWVHTLFPKCSVSRPWRLESAIRRIALPVERKSMTSKGESEREYLGRIWKPRISQQKAQGNMVHLCTWSVSFSHLSMVSSAKADRLSIKIGGSNNVQIGVETGSTTH